MPNRSKLTPETQIKIVKLLRSANFRETACAAAGVSSRAMRMWIAQAHKSREAGAEDIYTAFADAVDLAEAEAEAMLVQSVRKSAEVDPRHAEWMLEHGKFAERWGNKTQSKLEHSGPDGGPIVMTADPEAAARLVREAFGEHAMPYDDDDAEEDATGDTGPETAGTIPAGPPSG